MTTNAARRDLRTLQRWMAAVVEHPSTADVAVRSTAAQRFVPSRQVARVLQPNPRIGPTDQLAVYNGGYLARLVEVMQGDFGGVQQVVGETPFRTLVAAYLVRHPSRHQNLNQLGRHFPAFLRTRRGLAHRAFVTELAELELALCRAFDAPEFTPLSLAKLQEVPAGQWPAVRLRVNPSVQLLVTRQPVDAWYQAWKDGRTTKIPKPQRAWTLVFRRADQVWRQRLQRPAHAVLTAIAAGKPFAEALERAAGDARVGEWFRGFAADDLFTGVELPRRRRAV